MALHLAFVHLGFSQVSVLVLQVYPDLQSELFVHPHIFSPNPSSTHALPKYISPVVAAHSLGLQT
jgi:hypothetical protein